MPRSLAPRCTVTADTPFEQPNSYVFMFKQNRGSVHASHQKAGLSLVMMPLQRRACYRVMDCISIPLVEVKQHASNNTARVSLLPYCSFCHGWTLNDDCRFKDPHDWPRGHFSPSRCSPLKWDQRRMERGVWQIVKQIRGSGQVQEGGPGVGSFGGGWG